MNFNTKKEMIKTLAAKKEISKVKAKEMIEDVIGVMEELVLDKTHDGLDIYGFMKIPVKEVPERKARNPQDGTEVIVPAHYSPKPKMSKRIKDLVRE